MKSIEESLKINCEKCFGFCCVALFFSSSDGFPQNKEAGKPCMNLEEDFKCKIHKDLRKKGLKGCTSYDCFGAGQKVATHTYGGVDWRKDKNTAKEMFDVFIIVRALHEMLWYLTEGYEKTGFKECEELIEETVNLTYLSADKLLKIDLIAHRQKVNKILLNISKHIRKESSRVTKANLNRKKMMAGRVNLIGANLKNRSVIGEDLSGALLIASNLSGADLTGTDLIGADMRDTNLCGTNLENALYLTQIQINGARGDSKTKLPKRIVKPKVWL
ncbi:MAG: pentapeptide repeat-containing protein [Clostridium sp.]